MSPCRTGLATTAIYCLLGFQMASASPTITSAPSPIILGKHRSVVLRVEGFPADQTLQADVNVGTIENIELAGKQIIIRYKPPAHRFPQMLCLALWNQAGMDSPVQFFRLPMLAGTKIPVKTSPRSKVMIRVGVRTVGPFSSGKKGALTAKVLIPPGLDHAEVEVEDSAGLKTNKRIKIRRMSYNQLAMAIHTTNSESRKPGLRITVGSAERHKGSAMFQVGMQKIPLKAMPNGTWEGRWLPSQRPPEGQVAFKIWLPREIRSLRYGKVNISEIKFSIEMLRVRPKLGWQPAKGLRGTLGLGVGLVHNMGGMVAPRVSLDVGLDYPLFKGRIGLRLFTSFAQTSQQLALGAGLPMGESTVTMVPLGGGITYRQPFKYISPFILVGGLAHLIRTTNQVEGLTKRSRFDAAPGFLGLMGVDLTLGLGRFFLQGGYLWSELENQDVRILAGGLIFEGGYRLVL